MKEEYLPKTPEGRRWRLAEECGEVIQALGKIGRWGLDGTYEDGTTNSDKLLSEINDLKHAIKAVEGDLIKPAVIADGLLGNVKLSAKIDRIANALTKEIWAINPKDIRASVDPIDYRRKLEVAVRFYGGTPKEEIFIGAFPAEMDSDAIIMEMQDIVAGKMTKHRVGLDTHIYGVSDGTQA
jgi:hypothetical protein